MDSSFRWADEVWRQALEPEPQLTVSQWADRHRMLPATAAEPGPWRTSRVPYLREIMDCLSPSSPYETVVFMKGAQVGGTEAGNNWLGHIIAHAPGTALIVYPTIDTARRTTVTRIDPLIEASPLLRDLVVSPNSREPGNSAFRKAFPGGQLLLTGANSGVGLRSIPARYIFCDEIDAFPADVAGEGDPIALAIQRSVTFGSRRKIFLVSTPTLAGHSRIEAAYAESDQRRYFVPCRHCREYSPIDWKDIHWPEGRRQEAFWACPECGTAHAERAKAELLRRGEWRSTAPGDGKTAGFHLSALYSPWESWGAIAAEHGAVHRDPPRLQAWTNTKLGEVWQDMAGEAVEPDPLMARREDWGELLPDGVAVITAGVDIQTSGRAEISLTGWGADEESWVLRHIIVHGDPTAPALWRDIDTALAQTFEHRRAVAPLPIRAVCIDSGACTKDVYAYASARFARRVWAIKGRGGPGIPLWPRRPSKGKSNLPIFVVGVDAGKDTIFARLKLTEPGPGCIHFSKDLDAEYFRQLTAEKVMTRYSMGRPLRSWQPKRQGERNEALDCYNYSLAALHGLIAAGLNLNREAATIAAAPLRAAGAPAPAPAVRPSTIKSAWMQW